jgi:hypothetical protein
MRRHRLDALFLIQIYLDSQFCFSVLEIGGEFLLGMSETLFSSMSAPHVKIVPLLDVHQLIMFAVTLTYSGPGTFSCHII